MSNIQFPTTNLNLNTINIGYSGTSGSQYSMSALNGKKYFDTNGTATTITVGSGNPFSLNSLRGNYTYRCLFSDFTVTPSTSSDTYTNNSTTRLISLSYNHPINTTSGGVFITFNFTVSVPSGSRSLHFYATGTANGYAYFYIYLNGSRIQYAEFSVTDTNTNSGSPFNVSNGNTVEVWISANINSAAVGTLYMDSTMS